MARGFVLAFADALRDELLADSGVTGAGVTKVFPQGTGHNPAFPYITYAFITDSPRHGLGFNDPAYRMLRFQVDGYAETWTEAATTLDAVVTCLDGATLTVTGWGVPRLEGEGSVIVNEEVEGIPVYRSISRYKAVLAGTNVT